MIGETNVFYSNLITDGKVNLKLRSRDNNVNSLFGVSKRSLRSIGVLHVNFYVDSNTTNCSSRNSTVVDRRQSSLEHSSTITSAKNRCQQHLVKSICQKEFKFSRSTGSVMLVSGRTQAYLVSLLAPTIEVQLRQQSIRSVDSLIDSNY